MTLFDLLMMTFAECVTCTCSHVQTIFCYYTDAINLTGSEIAMIVIFVVVMPAVVLVPIAIVILLIFMLIKAIVYLTDDINLTDELNLCACRANIVLFPLLSDQHVDVVIF